MLYLLRQTAIEQHLAGSEGRERHACVHNYSDSIIHPSPLFYVELRKHHACVRNYNTFLPPLVCGTTVQIKRGA